MRGGKSKNLEASLSNISYIDNAKWGTGYLPGGSRTVLTPRPPNFTFSSSLSSERLLLFSLPKHHFYSKLAHTVSFYTDDLITPNNNLSIP